MLKYKDDVGLHMEHNWWLKALMNNGTLIVIKKEGTSNKEIILERIE